MKGLLTKTSLLIFLALGTSEASLITIDFGGTLSFVDPALSSGFVVGDSFNGSFTYDTSSPLDIGAVDDSDIPASGSVTVGSHSFTFPDGFLHFNSFFSAITCNNAVGELSGDTVNGASPELFLLQVAHAPGLIPDISSPPLDPLPLMPGLPGSFLIQFLDTPKIDAIFGETTSLAVRSQNVPDLASSSTLLVIALLMLRAASVSIRKHERS